MPREPDDRDPILQFFDLPVDAPTDHEAICGPYAALARVLTTGIPRNPERTVALRKLLESMDAALRARHWRP
jgi:hypothetical protein